MGEGIIQDKVIFLFDKYHTDSERLRDSFIAAGCDFPTVLIDDDGFLPNGIESVYGYFLGDFSKSANSLNRPRYFNEVLIPDYWEITSSNMSGKIIDREYERGRIYYVDASYKRHVKMVEWLDEKRQVRYSDYYNQYGAIYARVTHDQNSKAILKSYFSPDGKEVIVENLVTQNIILNQENTVKIFENKTQFVLYYLKLRKYDKHRIFFNSLSYPFFVCCQLNVARGHDILFWQEPVSKEIPGNMKMILNGNVKQVGQIYVQKRVAYNRLIELGADKDLVRKKGFLYPFVRNNRSRASALICTNSDQIEQCEKIVTSLPEIDFYIAAITEMSSKLLALGKYANVHLYPGIRSNMVDKLFAHCDIYLDINHANEILSAVRRAFLNNQVILAFSTTAHNLDYVAPEHIYKPEDVSDLIEVIRSIPGNSEFIKAMLKRQKTAALAENMKSFIKI